MIEVHRINRFNNSMKTRKRRCRRFNITEEYKTKERCITSDKCEILTTEDVMDYLLIGRNTMYELLRTGKIKGFKIGSCWKIPKKAVDDYIASESGMKI